MFSNFTPDEMLDAPAFDCLLRRFLGSNSSAVEFENNDSMSLWSNDVSTVVAGADDAWHAILGLCFLVKFSELDKDFGDENRVRRGLKVVKKEERRRWRLVVMFMSG